MGRCRGNFATGIGMTMQKTIALAIATLIAVAPLPAVSQSHARTGSSTIFIPPPTSGTPPAQKRHGDHYSNVDGNYTRRCNSLENQFNRLQARMGPSSAMNEALQLHAQGVEHCNGGARLQGIDELTAAIRTIGGIPRIEL